MDTVSATPTGNPLFACKPIGAAHKDEFKRTLGPVSLVALGIGAIIGAGIFSLTGIAAADNAGPAVVISFMIAALGCGFAGLCYSELSGMIPAAGSAYSYAYALTGRIGRLDHRLGADPGIRGSAPPPCRSVGPPMSPVSWPVSASPCRMRSPPRRSIWTPPATPPRAS